MHQVKYTSMQDHMPSGAIPCWHRRCTTVVDAATRVNNDVVTTFIDGRAIANGAIDSTDFERRLALGDSVLRAHRGGCWLQNLCIRLRRCFSAFIGNPARSFTLHVAALSSLFLSRCAALHLQLYLDSLHHCAEQLQFLGLYRLPRTILLASLPAPCMVGTRHFQSSTRRHLFIKVAEILKAEVQLLGEVGHGRSHGRDAIKFGGVASSVWRSFCARGLRRARRILQPLHELDFGQNDILPTSGLRQCVAHLGLHFAKLSEVLAENSQMPEVAHSWSASLPVACISCLGLAAHLVGHPLHEVRARDECE
mmetsp:Transcript_52607/g.98689  ORF Transcript_52607/g.98689 Transcript_52607/m.98689 type:complete len:309 (+) Transcript_52607:50-976(+)